MVENVGLGSAIAEGTDLRGNFGSPITQGLQLNQRNVIADAAREQAKAAKQQAMMEKMAKYTTFDEGVWADKKLAEEAQKVIREGTADIMLSMQAGDAIGAEQKKMRTKNKLGSLKLLDKDYASLKKLSPKNANTKRVLETFSKGGVGAIQKNDQKYFFAPDLIVNEDGSFEPIEYPNIKVNSSLNKVANSVLDQVVPNAKPVIVDGRAYRGIDKNSPEYVAAKQRTFEIFDENKNAVLASDEFRNYYDKYLKENKIPEDAVRVDFETDISGREIPPDYEAAYQKFISDKFDKIVTPPVTSTKLAQGKGRGSNPYDKSYNKFTYRFFDGETAIIDPSTNITKRTFNGVLANEASGNFEGEKEPILLETPKVKYDNQIKSFVIRGRDEYGDMVRIKVSPEELITTQGIENKEKLAELFPDYKPKQAAGGAGKPKEENKWSNYRRNK
jgi:hypothetical protein